MRPLHYTHTNSIYLLGIATLLSAQGLLDISQPKLFELDASKTAQETTPYVSEHTVEDKVSKVLEPTVNAVSVDAVEVNFLEVDTAILESDEKDALEVDSQEAVPREEIVFYDGENNSSIVFGENSDIAYMTLIDSATVSLEGGSVSNATLSDASAVEVSSSSRISDVDLRGNSTLIINGEADISYVTLHNFSTVEVSENSQISHLTLGDRAEGTILGGTFSSINLTDESEAHIRSMELDGGPFINPGMTVSGGAVVLEEGTELHVYGRSLAFSNGQISGFWTDETPFELPLIISNREDEGLAEIPTSLPAEVTFHEIEDAVKGNETETDGAGFLETEA